MFQLISSIITIWLIIPIQSFTIPVFGTKRYHRTPSNNVALVSNVNNPYLLYDDPSVFSQPSSSSSQNYQYSSYANNYNNNKNNDGYYYPSHPKMSRHMVYGTPTYHGEYNPTLYYYAPGPIYSYYDDDREISNNPLDDLHEEILQEDELERQREMFPIGQESWYTNSKDQQDAYTKNFLKNLIEYNREMEVAQQEQEMQRNQDNTYDDYMDSSEYEYEQHRQEQQQQQQQQQQNENPYELLNKYEKYQKQQRLKAQPQTVTSEKFDDMDDENVRQLKHLAKSKDSHKQNNKSNNKKAAHQVYYPNEDWQESKHSSLSMLSPEYEREADEYEDDNDWINWNTKRSDKKYMKNIFPYENSIRDFSNRKPSQIVQKPSTESTKNPSFSSTSTTTTSTTTTTPKPTVNGKFGQKEVVLPRPAAPVTHFLSQPVLDMLDKDSTIIQQQEQQQQQQQQPINNPYQHQMETPLTSLSQALPLDEAMNENADVVVNNLKTSSIQENKRSKELNTKSNANIYDTIKQLIAMEEQLKEEPMQLKLQKRFVSNEENLTHELDKLKHRTL